MKLATFDNVEGNCPVSFVAKSYGDTALVTSEKINGIQIATAWKAKGQRKIKNKKKSFIFQKYVQSAVFYSTKDKYWG